MANADSTLRNEPNTPDESYLAEEYPESGDPFSVFYSVGTGLKWAINDEDGMAIAEAANYEDAVKISNAFRAGAYRDAVKAAHELIMDMPNDKAAEYRAGAMACMDALRIIDRISASGKAEMTWEECWQNEDVSIRAMQHAAGNNGEFIAGFVAVFAEYAYMFISGGEPNLYKWQPVSSMTDKDIKKCRAKAENDCENLKGSADAKPEEANHA